MLVNMSRNENSDWQRIFDRLVHDLREPLRSITSFSELLSEVAKERLGAEGELAIGEVLAGAARMRILIDGISRFSATLQPHEDESQASLQLAFDMATLALASQIKATGATVTGDGLPKVAVKLDRFSVLMENLIGNSLLFRAEPSPVITVLAEPDTEKDWRVRVEDNGIGIRPEDCEAVFNPFVRIHGRKYPGAGMGLAVCRNIVQNHGGRIWMEPGRNGGAICSFTLPAAQSTSGFST
jgi:light-regulated signal transduction histidine kinase (bacteriophytochrome)